MLTTISPTQENAGPRPTLPEAVERLRADLPRLRELVLRVFRVHITDMTGPFSSSRQIPAFAEQVVSQFLDVLGGRVPAEEFQSQIRLWVQRGLGPEAALAAVDALYAAAVSGSDGDVLAPAVTLYRRDFTLAYERARRIEILGEHERMQRSLYAALERQIATERQLRDALERRQTQLQLASNLAHTTGLTRDLTELIGGVVRELVEGLHLAFAGIFLLDDFGAWAILRSGAGDAGASLLERGYQVNMNSLSPLVRAFALGEPILLRAGHYENEMFGESLLPESPQAIVAPLVAHGRTLGFLTLHGATDAAFTDQDLPLLGVIADNIAYAVENASLFARAQASLAELQQTQRGFVREAWTNQALEKQLVYSQQQDEFKTPEAPPPSNGSGADGALSVPITLRGQVIGTVDLFDATRARSWSPEEKALAAGVVEQMALALENARLFEEAQKRAQETTVLNDLARELSGEVHQEVLFAKVNEYLPRLMPTDAFVVWFYDAATDSTTRPVLYDLGEKYPPALTPSPLTARLRGVMESNEPLAINLTRQEWQTERANQAAIFGSSEPSASLLYVPLRFGGRVRGFLSVQSYRFDAYGPPQAALLTSVANQLAGALENAQLFAETREALSETQTLYAIGARLNQVDSLEQVVRIAAQPAFDEGAGSAQLLLMEYQGEAQPVAANVVVSLVAPGDPAPLSEFTFFPIEEFRLGQAMLANPRELVLIEDVVANPTLDEATRQVLLASNDRAVVLLPLSVENQVLGAIAIGWAEPHAFDERQRRIYSALAAQLALVLNNRLLFEQTQAALAETQTLYEIGARLTAATNLQEALEAAAGPAIVQGAASAALLRVHTGADGEPAELELVAQWPRNADNALPTGTRIPADMIAGDRTWIEHPTEPRVIGDVETEAGISAASREMYLSRGLRASALLPLKIGPRWVGMLSAGWQEPRTFSVRDTRLFRSIMAQAATVMDNRALFEQTQNALAQTRTALTQVEEAQDRLNLQYQTANILARTNSFDHAAPLLLENTCRSLNWQMGEYWAMDETTSRLVLTHLWTEGTRDLQDFAADSYGITFAPGEGLAGRTWAERQPIWVTDIRSDPDFKQADKATGAGLVSALAFPLQSEARPFGVTVFFSTHPQAPDETLLTTMIGVGSQIGQFMERRRAEEAVRQQNTYLTALHDTTLGLMRRLDVDELLQNIITRAGELVGTEHGYVHLIEPNASELRMRVGIGIYQDFVGTRVKAGQGLAGTVWQQQAPIIVDDYRYWQGRLPMVDRDVLRAVAGVPLKSGNETVGVLGLASLQDGRRFNAAQVEALGRFAELAAVALDNARLYSETQNALDQTRRAAEREKASAEIADKLYAVSDVKTVLQTAAEELRRTTGSRRAVVRLNLKTDVD